MIRKDEQIDAFVQGLRELGWIDGRNVQLDIRWAAGGDRIRQQYAAELVALVAGRRWPLEAASCRPLCCKRPALCLSCSPGPLTQSALGSSIASRVRAVTRPDFSIFDYNIAGKWLELLKQITPRL